MFQRRFDICAQKIGCHGFASLFSRRVINHYIYGHVITLPSHSVARIEFSSLLTFLCLHVLDMSTTPY
jgi:hypothetical protein